MRRPRVALLTAVLALLAACEPADRISAERGNWLFINYWAQWCKPCIHEVPELNALNALEGFAVLGVNYDGTTGEELALQEENLSIAFPTLASDPAARFAQDRPQVLPTTLVIDPRGELARVLVGPQTLESLRAATESGDKQG